MHKIKFGFLLPAVFYLLGGMGLRLVWKNEIAAVWILCLIVSAFYSLTHWQRPPEPRKIKARSMAGYLLWNGCLSTACTLLPGEALPDSWAAWSVLLLAGPISEELVYRGFVLERCEQRWAVPVSALLFGAAHPLGAPMAAAAVGGAFFAMVTLETGRVWPAVVLHMSFNLGSCLWSATGCPTWLAAIAAVAAIGTGVRFFQNRT